MNIIHGVNDIHLPRVAERALAEQLAAMPAVVLSGARQTGKSTLARELIGPTRTYRSLDELDVRDLARRQPEALTGTPGKLTLDEVQREPQLLLAVKQEIDRDRRSGRFLLTGSADLLLMQGVSESLAGRASYLTLRPMTRREQLGRGVCGRWDALVGSTEEEWLSRLGGDDATDDWIQLCLRGGFPTPAVEMQNERERHIWFSGYVRTYLERDLRELSSVSSLPDFRRLMQAAALRVGTLVNQTDLARDVGLSQPTVHRYLNLLETSYLLVRVPAYSVNRTKRLMKSPKLYWGDTGLALFLAGLSEPAGHHLENLVLNDLLVWRDARKDRAEILHWRTTSGEEVDFVIEMGESLIPIEVKATARPTVGDARHIRSFRREYGDRARPGLILHTGTTAEWLSADALALPWSHVV